jgi:hypothetical protein
MALSLAGLRSGWLTIFLIMGFIAVWTAIVTARAYLKPAPSS